jgi:uncharacterized protein YecA (UPF0149 family)
MKENIMKKKFNEAEKTAIINEVTPRGQIQQKINSLHMKLSGKINDCNKKIEDLKTDNQGMTEEEMKAAIDEIEKAVNNFLVEFNSRINRMNSLLSRVPAKRKKIKDIGRNDICPFCDAGKKYKKCCFDDISSEIAIDE